MSFVSIHEGNRIPTVASGEEVSYVMQSKHNKDANCDLGSYERAIIETWNINNPSNLVPSGYKWGGIHDSSILNYVIDEMK